jgi:RNA polymerase sigma-70 factor (ECF subfamily)
MSELRQDFELNAVPWLDHVHTAALRLTRDPTEAEDLVQETFVRAYRFWASFQTGTNVRAWLLTILRNTFITRYHQKNRARSLDQEVAAQVTVHGEAAAIATPESRPPEPENLLDESLERVRVAQALDSLPEDYRMAVTLADLNGLSYKEIAEIMNCPVGTVMSRIFRGRKLLHNLLFSHAVERGFIGQDARNTRQKRERLDERNDSKEDEVLSTQPTRPLLESGDSPLSIQDFRQRRNQA